MINNKITKYLLILTIPVFFVILLLIFFIHDSLNKTKQSSIDLPKITTNTIDTTPSTTPTKIVTISPTPTIAVSPTVTITNTPTPTPTPNTSSIKTDYIKYFKNDLFIGDSISEGLNFYEFVDDNNVYAHKGMSISSAREKINEIALLKPTRIFILFGVNDMDDKQPISWFTDKYSELVHDIKKALPNSKIYIQSIFPIWSQVEKTNAKIDNKLISDCNAGLKEMSIAENIGFINISEVVNDKTRSLYEQDGIHFQSKFYPIWLDYIVEFLNK